MFPNYNGMNGFNGVGTINPYQSQYNRMNDLINQQQQQQQQMVMDTNINVDNQQDSVFIPVDNAETAKNIYLK